MHVHELLCEKATTPVTKDFMERRGTREAEDLIQSHFQYCARPAPSLDYTIQKVVPVVSQGGENPSPIGHTPQSAHIVLMMLGRSDRPRDEIAAKFMQR